MTTPKVVISSSLNEMSFKNSYNEVLPSLTLLYIQTLLRSDMEAPASEAKASQMSSFAVVRPERSNSSVSTKCLRDVVPRNVLRAISVLRRIDEGVWWGISWGGLEFERMGEIKRTLR